MSDVVHIICPNCGATNRIPGTRLAEQPKCGRCHEGLFSGKPVELTANSFNKQLSHNELPLLVDFWAPWCGPCKTMAPAFEQAARELEPNFRLAKLNTEQQQVLAARYGIRSIPTLVLFRNGEEQARQAGAMGKADIVRWARSHGSQG